MNGRRPLTGFFLVMNQARQALITECADVLDLWFRTIFNVLRNN